MAHEATPPVPYRLRVGHLRVCTGIGGVETYLLSVAREQRARGLCPVVIAQPGAPTLALAREMDLETLEIAAAGPWSTLSFPRRLAEVLRAEGFHLLHTHNSYPFWAGWACRKAGIPHVSSLHRPVVPVASPQASPARRARFHRRQLQLLFVDRMIPVSYATRDFYVAQGISPDRMTVVWNGIDPSLYEGQDRERVRAEFAIPPEAFVFGIVGWLSRRKGHQYFFQAGARVCRARPQGHLLIVGRGKLQREMRSLARSLGIEDRCHFAGFRLDIPHVLAAFDCFVSSSLKEGMPMVLLEAMASSLPVVATRVGGVPELVQEGEHGLLAAPRSADSLEQAMLGMIDNPEQAREMGRRAQARIERHFTLEQTVRQLIDIYLDVPGPHRTQPLAGSPPSPSERGESVRTG